MTRFTAMLILGALASGQAVLAQSAAPAAGSTDAIPEKTAPGTAPATDLNTKAGTLSDKLSGTGGVIRPQGDVDPGIHKPAPEGGSMPVIPAPGSPGGATDVQPN